MEEDLRQSLRTSLEVLDEERERHRSIIRRNRDRWGEHYPSPNTTTPNPGSEQEESRRDRYRGHGGLDPPASEEDVNAARMEYQRSVERWNEEKEKLRKLRKRRRTMVSSIAIAGGGLSGLAGSAFGPIPAAVAGGVGGAISGIVAHSLLPAGKSDPPPLPNYTRQPASFPGFVNPPPYSVANQAPTAPSMLQITDSPGGAPATPQAGAAAAGAAVGAGAAATPQAAAGAATGGHIVFRSPPRSPVRNSDSECSTCCTPAYKCSCVNPPGSSRSGSQTRSHPRTETADSDLEITSTSGPSFGSRQSGYAGGGDASFLTSTPRKSDSKAPPARGQQNEDVSNPQNSPQKRAKLMHGGSQNQAGTPASGSSSRDPSAALRGEDSYRVCHGGRRGNYGYIFPLPTPATPEGSREAAMRARERGLGPSSPTRFAALPPPHLSPLSAAHATIPFAQSAEAAATAVGPGNTPAPDMSARWSEYGGGSPGRPIKDIFLKNAFQPFIDNLALVVFIFFLCCNTFQNT